MAFIKFLVFIAALLFKVYINVTPYFNSYNNDFLKIDIYIKVCYYTFRSLIILYFLDMLRLNERRVGADRA